MAPRIWLIAGPTASGKSALALRIAEETGAEIVNADALQVYRDLRVLSARPSAEDEARAPHHLFGVADAADGWTVGRWLTTVLAVLDDIQARGRPAIVVGGTGLYFRALTQGLADIPSVPAAVQREVEAHFDALDEAAFRDRLRALDPLAEARIAANDRQRLTRALAVAEATGRALSAWQADTRPALSADAWRGVVLDPPREVLHQRCDARLEVMMNQGAVEEAAALSARGLEDRLPAMKAVGLRELAAYARGETTRAKALAAAQAATRQYAKRQTTWFRNQAPDWPRIAAPDADAQWVEWRELDQTPAPVRSDRS
jgi:tRNA dimethylallyltransferase